MMISNVLLNSIYLKSARQKMVVTQKTAEAEGPPLLASEQAGSSCQMHLGQTTEFLNYPLHDKLSTSSEKKNIGITYHCTGLSKETYQPKLPANRSEPMDLLLLKEHPQQNSVHFPWYNMFWLHCMSCKSSTFPKSA